MAFHHNSSSQSSQWICHMIQDIEMATKMDEYELELLSGRPPTIMQSKEWWQWSACDTERVVGDTLWYVIRQYMEGRTFEFYDIVWGRGHHISSRSKEWSNGVYYLRDTGKQTGRWVIRQYFARRREVEVSLRFWEAWIGWCNEITIPLCKTLPLASACLVQTRSPCHVEFRFSRPCITLDAHCCHVEYSPATWNFPSCHVEQFDLPTATWIQTIFSSHRHRNRNI